jgi:hypothetical protein
MEYLEPELITIIEGPPPEIQLSQEMWSYSLWEGQIPKSLGVCQMRTFNGQAMLDRCRRAWQEGRSVRLDFPERDGLRRQVDVTAARTDQVPEGDLLYLWLVMPLVEHQIEIEPDDDEADDDPGALA